VPGIHFFKFLEVFAFSPAVQRNRDYMISGRKNI